MVSIDTNVLVRLLLGDDAAQLLRVKALFRKKETYTASVTVMLELVWVLDAYECTREEICGGLELLLGLPNFKPAHLPELRLALSWFEQGMDFADSLHLALSFDSNSMLTFDRKFVKLARKLRAGHLVLEVPGRI